MLKIPQAPEVPGARHVHSGKVRDLYELTQGPHAGELLMVASDRISAFDHVFDTTIPDKGEILTRLSLWWFEQFDDIVGNHVISTEVPTGLEGPAVVCRKLQMFPVECVARGYLTGSGLREYDDTGAVCGIELPPGLVEGSRLAEPIFTPATKAELGDHDENVSFEHVAGQVGDGDAAELRRLTLAVYARADEIARGAGLILADTKFEFGLAAGTTRDGADLGTRTILLADEVLTPDSSRYWDAAAWQPGRPTPSFDKDVIRRWLLSPEAGWDRASGATPPPLPPEIVERTRAKYVEVYEKLTGRPF